MDELFEVKKKKEFSRLPDSIVLRALEVCKGDVKGSRAFLRKYFGLFLTNKVVRGKTKEVLKSHISSKNRDYQEFYSELAEGFSGFESVIDLGCGANGFSYEYLVEVFGDVEYVGVEASGQIVENLNLFFKEKGFDAKAFCCDLMGLEIIEEKILKMKRPLAIFLFQVIDALESLEKDYSKKLLFKVRGMMGEKDIVFLSVPLKSIGGRKRFEVDRKWLSDFLEKNFDLKKDFEMGGERFFVLGKRL